MFDQEYEIVTPDYAHQIFTWLTTNKTAEIVSIKGFTDPDHTTIPPNLMALKVGQLIQINKLHTEDKSTALTITEELDRTRPRTMAELGGTFEFVPPTH